MTMYIKEYNMDFTSHIQEVDNYRQIIVLSNSVSTMKCFLHKMFIWYMLHALFVYIYTMFVYIDNK